MSSKWNTCANCGRRFRPSVYRPDQEYCFRAGCRRESDRVARNRYRLKRVEEDPRFLAEEAQRVARCRKGRRGRGKRGAVGDVDQVQVLTEMVVGMAAHLHGDEEGADSTGALLHHLRSIGRERCEAPADLSEVFLACTGSGFE